MSKFSFPCVEFKHLLFVLIATAPRHLRTKETQHAQSQAKSTSKSSKKPGPSSLTSLKHSTSKSSAAKWVRTFLITQVSVPCPMYNCAIWHRRIGSSLTSHASQGPRNKPSVQSKKHCRSTRLLPTRPCSNRIILPCSSSLSRQCQGWH